MRVYKTWQRTSYKKKKRCERCSASKSLVVHHRDRNRANNLRSNLETLCRPCHRMEHAIEITAAQRKVDVNKRRGAAVSKARKGNHYENTSKALRIVWQGSVGIKQRRQRRSAVNRRRLSIMAKRLMNDPAHIAKRRAMREDRNVGA